ncbi:MAG: hypothetical protein JO101_13250 [Candidatus Eremiobacteraeota bacterium]|nr:hypothetical protein [Candidatus Eremiobacteraeota bacterium]MBV8356285.1 hypothetical protein [Candidatus Eremiobacteraeota bacterium]
MKVQIAALALAVLAGCTPGADRSTSLSSTAGAASIVTIDVSLTEHAPTTTPEGSSGGYAPPVTIVPLGSFVRFVNSDSFAHTATFIGAAQMTAVFPASSPFGAGDLQQFGMSISLGWSSGALQPGASSQLFLADKAGTYLYGCFFHYGSPMRGVIVVQ